MNSRPAWATKGHCVSKKVGGGGGEEEETLVRTATHTCCALSISELLWALC